MSVIDDIFTEYQRMRHHGLDTREALKALRAYIEPLNRADKEALAQQMKTWEKEYAEARKDATQSKRPSVIKPLKPSERDTIPAPIPTTTSSAAENPGAWVECRNCGKKNRSLDVFCYSCGQILELDLSAFDTRQFADATDTLFSDDYFGPDSVLIMTVKPDGAAFEIRPQSRSHELVIGRGTDNSAMRPDVDLTTAKAAELGVSRLHVGLRYDAKDNTIQVYDLGSANGTFLNGQKLHPRELRLLRNHDEVRMGKLVLKVQYQHPGEEIRARL